MAWKIQITQAKPNPAGKDKSQGRPIAAQLLGEWVDLKNIGDAAVSLSTLHLAQSKFGPGCQLKERASIYWNRVPSIALSPGETVRVHTGHESDSYLMSTEDRSGVHHHAYVNNGNFVLNNDCGDNLSIWWQGNDKQWHQDDAASYDAYPPEGQILRRVGSKLMPGVVPARW